MGKSQSKWTACKVETPGSQRCVPLRRGALGLRVLLLQARALGRHGLAVLGAAPLLRPRHRLLQLRRGHGRHRRRLFSRARLPATVGAGWVCQLGEARVSVEWGDRAAHRLRLRELHLSPDARAQRMRVRVRSLGGVCQLLRTRVVRLAARGARP
jgi:hypothetical protein